MPVWRRPARCPPPPCGLITPWDQARAVVGGQAGRAPLIWLAELGVGEGGSLPGFGRPGLQAGRRRTPRHGRGGLVGGHRRALHADVHAAVAPGTAYTYDS